MIPAGHANAALPMIILGVCSIIGFSTGDGGVVGIARHAKADEWSIGCESRR